MHERLMKLSTYGKNEAGGSDRQAFTKHDIEAREYVKKINGRCRSGSFC
ncbi:hypothetical protein [Algoriphagus boritolerans]